MSIAAWINSTIVFFAEIGMLASFFIFGLSLHLPRVARIALALAIPIIAAVLWGMFFAPKASIHLAQPWNALGEYTLFGLGGAALIASGRTTLGIIFLVVAFVSETLSFVLS